MSKLTNDAGAAFEGEPPKMHKITLEITEETKELLEGIAVHMTEAAGENVPIEMVAQGLLTAEYMTTLIGGEGG